jgi:lysine-specific histone demethylase 1
VTGIEQGANSVTVTTAGGANFTARYAILTASLGLLKDGGIDFQPPLPPAKLAAIDEMGFGVLDKAVFVFEAPFWDAQADFILRQMDDWSGRW